MLPIASQIHLLNLASRKLLKRSTCLSYSRCVRDARYHGYEHNRQKRNYPIDSHRRPNSWKINQTVIQLYNYSITRAHHKVSGVLNNRSESNTESIKLGYLKPDIRYLEIVARGETFTVGYTDEGPREAPVVLALHGVPGTTYDFDTLFQPLLESGHRVLTLNFPGNYSK